MEYGFNKGGDMITKTTVHKGFIGNKNGYAFSVYFNNAKYPGIISALFKTKKEAEKELEIYLKTGEFKTYGSAE